MIMDEIIMPCEELMIAELHRKFYFLNSLDIVNIREDNKELIVPLYELDSVTSSRNSQGNTSGHYVKKLNQDRGLQDHFNHINPIYSKLGD